MKIAVKRLIRDEKGQTLVLALILLVVGGLIITPLLAYMSTGLITGEVYERRMDELYAADAGVEDAIWRIQSNNLTFDADNRFYPEPLNVNDKSVDVVIYREVISETACYKEYRYQILSNATGTDGSGTKIEAYISGTIVSYNYSGILNQIVTSQNGTDIKDNVILNYTGDHGLVENYTGPWPTANIVADFYWPDVEEYGSGTINLAGVDMDEGPLYRDGELDILNSINDEATLTLTGTLYITGDTEIGNTDHDFTLDLNGHTIFVASNSTGKGNEALQIGGRCTIEGPGAIIAIGDVYFGPNGDAGSASEPVFVLSVLGTTTIRPGINIYGALAGSVSVDVQSGNKPTINYPTGGFGDLNFPQGVEKRSYSILSWQVSGL